MTLFQKFLDICEKGMVIQEEHYKTIHFDTVDEMIEFLEKAGRRKEARMVKANPEKHKNLELIEWK